MKKGAVIAVAAGVAGVVTLLLLSGSSKAAPQPFSAALREPMLGGTRYMVTFSVPSTMTRQEAAALLSFVASWGETIAPLQFAPDRSGALTAIVQARTFEPMPSGPPSIPGAEKGDLIPIAWAVLP